MFFSPEQRFWAEDGEGSWSQKKENKSQTNKKQEIERPERWVTDSACYSKSAGSGLANTSPLISELTENPREWLRDMSQRSRTEVREKDKKAQQLSEHFDYFRPILIL